MPNYNNIFITHINQIQQEGRYREFIALNRLAGDFPKALDRVNDHEIVVWCINDYLGMSQNQDVLDSAAIA